MIDTIIFVVSAVIAVGAAVMMISQRNPVLSVLYFIVSLIAQAVLYVQLGALFLGAVLIIVYSGAILVLFLFVIMILNLRGTEDLGAKRPLASRFSKYLVSILLLIELVFIVKASLFSEATIGVMETAPTEFGSVEQVGELLFKHYLYPFELTSILLLAAIVGAVVMAGRQRGTEGEEGEQQPVQPDAKTEEEV